MAQYTAKERLSAAFQRRTLDRVPIFVNALRSRGAIEHLTGKQMEGHAIQVVVEAIRQVPIDLLARVLLVDTAGNTMLPLAEPVTEVEKDLTWRRLSFRRWIVSRPFNDPADAMAWAREHLCIDAGQAEVDAKAYLRTYEQHQKMLGEHTVLLPSLPMFHASVHELIGLELFSLLMYDDPMGLEEVIEQSHQYCLHYAQVMARKWAGPIIRIPEDLGGKGAPLFSPSWLREVFFPRLKRIADVIHNAGKYFQLHTCGNVTLLLDDIVGAGVDALDPLESTAGMSLSDVKARYGNQLVLMGNADLNVIFRGSEEEVRREVRRCIDEGSAGAGYLLHAVGGFDDVPAPNVIAFFNEACRYHHA